MQDFLLSEPILVFLKIFIVANALMAAVALMTYVERRLSAIIQFRLGRNRVRSFGLLQPLADGIKFLMKEDIIPARVDRPLFILAPAMAFVVALVGLAVVPWGGWVDLDGDGTTDVACPPPRGRVDPAG